MKEIKLVSLPVVNHNIQKDSEVLDKYIKDLNLPNQVASTETVVFLKKERAICNKESTAVKSILKAFIDAVSIPIVKIKNDVKTELLEKYEKLDGEFKTKIATVEDAVKDEKKKNLTEYFNECCMAADIDFIKFDQVKLVINLTNTETKLKKECEEFFVKVAGDLALIDTQVGNEAEILAEYKQSLNVSISIKTVVDRKQREKTEKDRLAMKAWDKRKQILLSHSVVYHSETQTFEYNEYIYVGEAECRAANDAEFNKIVSILSVQILAHNKPEGTAAKAEPIKSPSSYHTAPKPERIETARFKAEGLLLDLKKIRPFCEANGIKLTNIKNN